MIIRFRQFRLRTICKCLVLLFCLICLIKGRPKFIFRSSWHIPWLTNVLLVQPLECVFSEEFPEWPTIHSTVDHLEAKIENQLTVIIVTARPEFKRLPLTLIALASHLVPKNIFKVIFLTPPKDAALLEPFVSESKSHHWPWPVAIQQDDYLLTHIHTDSYRLQMIFKLVIAQIIQTEYYMILDSDCVALRPIRVEELLWLNQNSFINVGIQPNFQAYYQQEERGDHPTWWSESEQLLKIKTGSCVSNSLNSKTVGVTPIILSRNISLRTLCRLQRLYGKKQFLNKLANWYLWRLFFGRMWTEYTLYYLTGKCTKTFDLHHVDSETLSKRNITWSVDLYGPSIWWRTDWTSYNRKILRQLVLDGLDKRKRKSTSYGQLFMVLQGRQYVDPRLFHELFFPCYRQQLAQSTKNGKLLEILDHMTSVLLLS